ncbi:MAG: hypothetical protein K9N49_10495 [Candidatus Marinimicrobia bacterium]|nr:hypothetical protein [Candidatus Neomarinimicrobiota bacterium]
MLAGQVREALDLVRELQGTVLDGQAFRGYSGWTRAASGVGALGAAAVMSRGFYPATNWAHVIGWGALFVAALFLNAGALLYWFWFDPRVRRDVRRLRPILDSVAPLAVGGALTYGLLQHRLFDPLFGVWMCMFGLTNWASRLVLPRPIAWVGIFYILCGAVWLALPGAAFLNPWPMGLIFFAGELAGGLILHFDQTRYLSWIRSPEPGAAATRTTP